MINDYAMSGLGLMEKPKPLISFRTIIDENMSLVKYVIRKYNKSKYFDLMNDIRSKSYLDILFCVYDCPSKNPLHILGTNHDFLDNVYAEIMDPHDVYLYKILSHGISTDMYKAAMEFKKSGDILPKILCYNEVELQILDEDDRTKHMGVLLDDINTDDYTQIYLEYIDDITPFKDMENVTFYFSTRSYNFDGDLDHLKSDFDKEEVNEILKRGSHINVFDLYNMDVFKNTESYKLYEERIKNNGDNKRYE